MRPHGRNGRAHRRRPYQPSSNTSTTQSSLILCSGKLFSSNLITQAIREMVGAVPVCPPERPRSGVSICKEHVPISKEGISIHKRCMPTSKHVCAFADGCALMGRHGRAHRRRPYQPPSNTSTTQSSLILCSGELFDCNLMTQTIREMVGAAPVCPPERRAAAFPSAKNTSTSAKAAFSSAIVTLSFANVAFPAAITTLYNRSRWRLHPPPPYYIYKSCTRALLSMLHHKAMLCFPWCDTFQSRHCMCFMA